MRNRKIAILFFTMVVVMLGFGIIIPILPFYIENMGANASQLGLLMAIFSVMQFIFSPLWGSLSDRIGRKPVLMIGAFGNALTQILMGFSTEFWMLLAARALAGVLSSATLPTAMAYIGDSTSTTKRSGGMGMIGAAMGMGMVLGPGLGGWMAGRGLSAPFFLAGGLSALALVLILLILPESLPAEKRHTQAVKFGGPDLGMMWRSLWGPVGFLLFLAFIINFALANFEGIFGLYTMHRFSYGPERVGTIMTVIGLISVIVQGMATGPVTNRFGEGTVIKASLIGSAVGFVLMLFANSFPAVLLTVGLFVTSNAMLRPAIASAASKHAHEGQGMAMGLNNAFQSLGRTVGPLWAGTAFDLNIFLPYASAAVVMLGSFVWAMVVPRSSMEPEQAVTPTSAD